MSSNRYSISPHSPPLRAVIEGEGGTYRERERRGGGGRGGSHGLKLLFFCPKLLFGAGGKALHQAPFPVEFKESAFLSLSLSLALSRSLSLSFALYLSLYLGFAFQVRLGAA